MSTSPPPFWTSTEPAATRLIGTYADLVATRVSEDPVPAYDRGTAYGLGSVLDHHVYGVGVVVQATRGKVAVRFSDQDRLLVCGVGG